MREVAQPLLVVAGRERLNSDTIIIAPVSRLIFARYFDFLLTALLL